MLTMQTVVLEQPGRFGLTDTAEPTAVATDHALVRVRRIGVCGTDLHAFAGVQPFFEYPRILGHELGVEVVAVGEGVTRVAVGDQCAVEPYLNCGACVACRAGRSNCCASLRVLGVHVDGGMRPLIVVPADKLHKSTAMSLDQLALVETLGIGAHAVARGQPVKGEPTVVIGAGPIGLSIIQFAQLAEAEVAVIDVNEQRLAFCADQLGVKHCFKAGGHVPDDLRRTFGGQLPTLVFDATGNATSMARAFDLLESTARLVLVGIVQGHVSFNDPQFHRRELTILASRNSTANDFTRIIDLIERGHIDTTPWITHRSTLTEAPESFPVWRDPSSRTIKAMIEL